MTRSRSYCYHTVSLVGAAVICVWTMSACGGSDEVTADASVQPDAAATLDGGNSISDEQLQEVAGDTQTVSETTAELYRALGTVAGDSEFARMTAAPAAVASLNCELLDGKEVKQCPTYSVACEQGALVGLELTYGNGDCTACKKAGIDISGTVTIARTGVGSYTLTFDGYNYGSLQLDGTLTAAVSRDDGMDVSLSTGADPLIVTKNPGADTEKVLDVTLSTFELHFAPTSTPAWSVAMALQVQQQGSARQIAVATEDIDGDQDPLSSAQLLDGCGPDAGSIKVTVELGAVSAGLLVSFSDAPASEDGACNNIEVDKVFSHPEAGNGALLDNAATAAQAALTGLVGATAPADLLGGALDSVGHTTALRIAKALLETADVGAIRAAMTEGWSTLVCDAETSVACDSGTRATVVSCGAGSVVQQVTATFAACVVDGNTLQGEVVLERDLISMVTKGTATFNSFSINNMSVQGSATVTAGTTAEVDYQVTMETDDGDLTISAAGSPECAYDLVIDTLRLTLDEAPVAYKELELAGDKYTESGRYGILTRSPYLRWEAADACTCPKVGSTLDLALPVSNPVRPDEFGEVVMRITYGAGDTETCAIATAEATTWPFTVRSVAVGKAEAEAQAAALLTAMCTTIE